MIHHSVSTIGTPDGTRTLVERHYDAQKDLAAAVLGSMMTDMHSEHIWFYPEIDYATGTRRGEYMESGSLTLAVRRCLGLIDTACADSIRTVEAIARQIEDSIPPLPGLDVHRQRLQGRRGYKINPHKVLRGQLSTAWTRVHRETQLQATGIVTLVLCTDYTASATSAGAQHTIAATLALARKIEESGRRCEIWASILTHDAHRMRYRSGTSYLAPGAPAEFDELDHVVVKRAEEDLSAPCLAALCSLSLVRALFFQIWRLQYGSLGFLCNTGSATDKAQVHARLQAYCLREHIAPESVLMGADENDNLHTVPRAVAWVSAWLRHIAQPVMLAAQEGN